MEGHDTRPLIAITMGDPAGIGAEVSLKALLEPNVYSLCRPLVVGTLGVLTQIRDVLQSAQHLQAVRSPAEGRYTLGTVDVLDLADEHPGPFLSGVAAKENGAAAVAYVERAIALALTGEVDAIATAPLNKEAMRAAGFPYDGHTELLAVKTGTKVYTMMLASGDFRVFHVSTHVSLRGAIERATKARVLQVIELAYREIQRMGVAEPRLAVGDSILTPASMGCSAMKKFMRSAQRWRRRRHAVGTSAAPSLQTPFLPAPSAATSMGSSPCTMTRGTSPSR
jgi:4-hydroxythreonine-4-phosphate dehydrogenase